MNTAIFPKYYEYTTTGLVPSNNNFFKGLYVRDIEDDLDNLHNQRLTGC